jgi:CubicO group peptidase (beta-lactamase class C family)
MKLVAQIPNSATATAILRQDGDASLLFGTVQDRTPATGAPGETLSYSNTNCTLLGLVIEHVTHISPLDAFEI